MLKTIRLMVMAVLSVTAVFAADYTWDGSSGSFQTDTHWSPVGVPGIADQAKFTTAGTYGVSFTGDATNRYATVGASAGATVAFDLAGYTWWVTNNLAFANTGTARFSGGRLRVGCDNQTNSTSTITVAANQKLVLTNNATDFMGNLNTSAGGTIEALGGDTIVSWAVNLSAAPAGAPSLRLTAGSFAMTNKIDGSRFTLNDGAKVSLDGGTFSVGSTMDMRGTRASPSVLDINSNATMICTGWGITISRNAGGLGILNINGGTLAFSNGAFTVASSGVSTSVTTGLVNLVDGAVYARDIRLGVTTNAVGILRQTGGQLQALSESFLGRDVGTASGILSIEGGSALFNNKLNIGYVANGKGEVNLAGGTLTVAGDIIMGVSSGSSGELNVTGGTLVSGGSTVIGSAAGAVGRAVVSGGTNNFLNTVTVGLTGEGALTITGGTQLGTNVLLNVAGNLGSSGTLEISGGTNLFKQMTFGVLGTALVKITGGYTWATNRLVVGNSWGATGRVELTGGVLAVSTIDGRDPTLSSNPGGISKILFDGGTLQHAAYLSDFKDVMVAGFGEACLTDRGAVFDTAGGIRTIFQSLSNEVGYAGSLTKKGEGTLKLSMYNAFTGRVTVEQGELSVVNSGAIYLTGGTVIDPGAILNLASAGAILDSTTASGTVSRIDGALTLKSGTVLTNGVGAVLGGSGVVTGSVVFASGSAYGRDKAGPTGALRVTGNTVFEAGATVRLTGYTEQDLKAGVPLLTADASGTLEVSGALPVTLDGASYVYWWAKVTTDGKTLVARYIPNGTMISVR